MLSWAMGTDGLFLLMATLVLAGAACVFSASRALGAFVLVALLVWAVATPIAASDAIGLRAGIAAALWVLGVVIVDALPLGLLVARAAPARRILAAAAFLLVLQAPLAYVSQVLLQCYVGHYCPGIR